MVPPGQRDYAYQQAVEALRVFLTELAATHPPVLSPMLQEHFGGQLAEVWSRAVLLYNELMPEQPFQDLSAPAFTLMEHQEPFHELGRIAATLADQFGQVTTNLYSTNSPTDEQIVLERCSAVEEILDSITFSIDGAEESSYISAAQASW